MQRKSFDIWVGLFVLLGAVALLFLALKAGNMSSFSFEKTYSVTAKFGNIGGLKARAPVKSAGVVVGRVSDIAFDNKDYHAVVTLELEQRYAFPKDSTSAKILTSGLLGEQYVGLEVEPGDPTVEHPNLAEGDAVARSDDAMVLEKLIDALVASKASE